MDIVSCDHWSNSSSSSNWGINMMDRKVGGSNSETQSIGNVVDSLDDAIGINVAVASTSNTISCLNLLFDGVTIIVAVVVLAKVILSVVLRYR